MVVLTLKQCIHLTRCHSCLKLAESCGISRHKCTVSLCLATNVTCDKCINEVKVLQNGLSDLFVRAVGFESLLHVLQVGHHLDLCSNRSHLLLHLTLQHIVDGIAIKSSKNICLVYACLSVNISRQLNGLAEGEGMGHDSCWNATLVGLFIKEKFALRFLVGYEEHVEIIIALFHLRFPIGIMVVVITPEQATVENLWVKILLDAPLAWYLYS